MEDAAAKTVVAVNLIQSKTKRMRKGEKKRRRRREEERDRSITRKPVELDDTCTTEITTTYT